MGKDEMIGIYIITGCGLFFMITICVIMLRISRHLPFTKLGHFNYSIKLHNIYNEYNCIKNNVINLKLELKEVNQYIEKLKAIVALLIERTNILMTKDDKNLLIIKEDLEKYTIEFHKDIQQEIIYIDKKINDCMVFNDYFRKYDNKSYMPFKIIKIIKNQEEDFVIIKNSIEILSGIYNKYMQILNDIENYLKQYE